MAFERLAVACAALGAAGALRIAYYHFLREPPGELPAAHALRIDDRYRELRAALPARGKVVYLSDEDLDGERGARLYVQALYALGPLVLMRDDGRAAIGIADVSEPARLDDVARRGGFRVERAFGPVALLRRGP